jgi:hypothetical protein
MKEYKILKQGFVETTKKFESRLNAICEKGWKPISIGYNNSGVAVLLEKADKDYTY